MPKGNVQLSKVFIPDSSICANCSIMYKCVGDETKSRLAIERTHFAEYMKPLIGIKIEKEIKDGEKIKVDFTEDGNNHMYSDTKKRSHTLQLEDLLDMESILKRAKYVDEAEKDPKHNNNPFDHFYYFKVKLHKKYVYINVGRDKWKSKSGRIKYNYVCYSITDKIRGTKGDT